MIQAKAFGVQSATDTFKPLEIQRRDPRPDDVVIEIKFSGICHSDIHTARGEWQGTQYPCVPGHEIVGHITQVGKKVKKFKLGEAVGVGCFVDSCGTCKNCKANEEQFCEKGATFTYNSADKISKTHTLGGYSSHITVNQDYVLKLQKNLKPEQLAKVAPLLCAGITTYSPLKRYKAGKGKKVGVVGLGGLGHMAIKIAKAMGAEVTVFSTSANKQLDAKKLGAKNFVISSDAKNFEKVVRHFDLIIDTVSANHDLNPYLTSLKNDGTMVLLGVPPTPYSIGAFPFIGGRKRLTGSLIGGIKETQEMLNFCLKKKVFSEIELINADQINTAYDRTVKGDVKYRFVIDAKTF